MNDFNWSPPEKKIARRVFMEAVRAELAEIMAEFKTRAANAKTPDDMWVLEGWLGKTRRDFDNKYDYRYSQLGPIFGRLLYEKRIELESLEGLAQEKLDDFARSAAALDEIADQMRAKPARQRFHE